MAQSNAVDRKFIKCFGNFRQFFQINWWWVEYGGVSFHPKLQLTQSESFSACNDTASSTDKWLDRLEHSNWMSLVLNSLNAACVVAQCLDQEGSPVLVHGGKGLDSTLIVTSLVQIILNPDCRSVRGIQALIEREWIQAGYPFATRHKHSCYTPSQNRPKTSASTFVLFLDCVYQLHCQFPFSFEFGTQMLILLFEHSFFSSYGTFLGDSERERESIKLHAKTTSLWSYLNRPDVLKSLLNPMYEPNQGVIWPSVAPISLELWSGKSILANQIKCIRHSWSSHLSTWIAELYLRWVIDQTQVKSMFHQIQTLIAKEKETRSKVFNYLLLSHPDNPIYHIHVSDKANSILVSIWSAGGEITEWTECPVQGVPRTY